MKCIGRFRMFLLGVLMATVATSFGAYNAAKPADNEYVADVPALVRENFRAIKDDAIVNAGTVSGLSVGNASGNIPRSNGTLNTNLNADLLDGFHASAFNASDALLLRLDGSRAMTGSLKFSGGYGSLPSTSDGADNCYVHLSGGGAAHDSNRGSYIVVNGNERALDAGVLYYRAGNVSTGDHVFYTSTGVERFRIAYDGTITAASNLRFSGNYGIERNTADGSDTGFVYITGGSGGGVNRGAVILLSGNERSSAAGQALYYAGNVSTGDHIFYTGADTARMVLKYGGNLLLGATTDDGSNKLQVTGNAKITGTIESTGAATVGGDLTVTGAGANFRNAIKAVDGRGSGVDADRVQGVDLAPQEKAAQTMGAAGWYRIAQSVSGIGRNYGIFEIDWAQSGYHGAATIAAGHLYGSERGTCLNLIGLSFYPSAAPTGITKARIVYHTTYSGNYAYLEVYADRNLSNTVAYRISQALGWTLINATAGSIPSGYTSQEIAFVDCNLNHGKAAWKTPGTYTWTCPPGVFKVWVDAVGGGGGGGGGNGTILGGGGGAGGSAKDYEVSVTPGTRYTVVVGAGGQGGISTTNDGYGSPGTATTFNGVTMGGAGTGAGDLINASEGGYGGSGVTSYGGPGASGGAGRAGMGGSGIFGGGANFSPIPIGAGGHGVYSAGFRAGNGGNGFLSITW